MLFLAFVMDGQRGIEITCYLFFFRSHVWLKFCHQFRKKKGKGVGTEANRRMILHNRGVVIYLATTLLNICSSHSFLVGWCEGWGWETNETIDTNGSRNTRNARKWKWMNKIERKREKRNERESWERAKWRFVVIKLSCTWPCPSRMLFDVLLCCHCCLLAFARKLKSSVWRFSQTLSEVQQVVGSRRRANAHWVSDTVIPHLERLKDLKTNTPPFSRS